MFIVSQAVGERPVSPHSAKIAKKRPEDVSARYTVYGRGGVSETERESHTHRESVSVCVSLGPRCVRAQTEGGRLQAWRGGTGRQGGARRSPHTRHTDPARAGRWHGPLSLARAHLRVCHTQHSSVTHRIHAHTVYITSHKPSHTNTERNSHGHADKTRTHSRDAVPASLLCCSAHCHSAQGARTAWPPMAAHGSPWRLQRGSQRVARGACMARATGPWHAAHGTWRTARGSWHVGGWVVRAWHAHVASRAA